MSGKNCLIPGAPRQTTGDVTGCLTGGSTIDPPVRLPLAAGCAEAVHFPSHIVLFTQEVRLSSERKREIRRRRKRRRERIKARIRELKAQKKAKKK